VRQALVERATVGGRGRQGLLRPRGLSHFTCSRRTELQFWRQLTCLTTTGLHQGSRQDER
jgi:hypothetical protein